LAIIVNKEKKRRNIAFACKDLLLENGINELTIAQIAKTAGVGKGTIYEYFENKEDIVFELMTCMQDDYDERLRTKLLELPNVFSKTIALFTLFLSDDDEVIKQREIYKQFLIICLSNPSDNIKQYNGHVREKYISILSQITKNTELSIKMYDDIIGIFVASNILDEYDLQENIRTYIRKQIDTLNIGEEKNV